MEDFLRRFHQRCDTSVENDDGDDHRRQIFHAPVADRMSFVRRTIRQLGADNGDHAREHIGEIVDSIENDGDGAGSKTHQRFENDQHNIREDADHARPHDHLLALCFFTHCCRLLLFIAPIIPQCWEK